MTKITVITLLFSTISFGLSTEEANKVVNQYEGFSQRVLGFINCLSKVISGEEAIAPVDNKETKKSLPPPASLEGCFAIAGFKMGEGFSKITAILSKENGKPGVQTPPAKKEDLDQMAEEVRNELLQEAQKQRQPAAENKEAKKGW